MTNLYYEGERCGRTTRKNTPCLNPAGYKTDHVGSGACHLHGGRSPGAPPGNKFAVTHGAYETITTALYTDEENAVRAFSPTEALPLTRKTIAILEVREYRMLRRIKDLQDRIARGEHMDVVSDELQAGWNVKGKVDLRTQTRETLVTSIIACDAALGVIQQRKAQYIALLHKLESADPPQDDPLLEFMARMDNEEAEYRRETQELEQTP